MNDVMEQIKTLSATLDEETTRFHPTGRLLLLGSYESVFLKAVKRKADLLGIDCDLTQYPCPPYKAVVVDRETVPSDIKLTAEVDIDHSYSQGMSSVSQATLALLLALDLVYAKDITIVGRGHAVQNLAKYLTLDNATVTVAHSKTKSLLQATMNRDVVIYATPTTMFLMRSVPRRMIGTARTWFLTTSRQSNLSITPWRKRSTTGTVWSRL